MSFLSEQSKDEASSPESFSNEDLFSADSEGEVPAAEPSLCKSKRLKALQARFRAISNGVIPESITKAFLSVLLPQSLCP